MHPVAIILALIIGGVFVGGAAYAAIHSKTHTGLKRWLATTGYLLMAVGGFGFFGQALCNFGAFRFVPSTFEWPVGQARGILVMPDGKHVVPLTDLRRVQIYGPDWTFLRGWFVDENSKTFTLRPLGTNQIEVITSRSEMRYVFDLNGSLLAQESYAPQRYADFWIGGRSSAVPTRWWLWMFTSPFHSWLVMITGAVLVFLTNRAKTGHSEIKHDKPLPKQ